jgi:chromosome segregation ATPase
MDNKCLEQRLLTRESTVGGSVGSSVSRCAAKFMNLTTSKKAFEASEKKEDIVTVPLDSFIREMYLYRLDITKTQQIVHSCDEEIESYHSLENEIAKKIEATKAMILQLETELDHERQIRTHREELEEKAKAVNTLPTRSHLKRKIDATNENISSLNDATVIADSRLTQRHKQFNALLQCIFDLQGKLVEEEEVAVAADTTNDDEEVDVDREDGEDGRENSRYNQDAPHKKSGDGDGDADAEGEADVDECATQATNEEGTVAESAAEGSVAGDVEDSQKMDVDGVDASSADVLDALEGDK